MRIAIVGATGVIGSAVAEALGSGGHDIVRAARSGADIDIDATDPSSIESFFAQLGRYDALVSLIGSGGMGPLAKLGEEDFTLGWRTKMLAQVNLVRFGLPSIADSGSFTLSSGFLSKEPMPGFAAIALANGAIDAFCRAAAVEMPRGIRINCVSPVFVIESMRAAGMTDLSGYETQSAADTARGYVDAVTGTANGRDIDPRLS